MIVSTLVLATLELQGWNDLTAHLNVFINPKLNSSLNLQMQVNIHYYSLLW